jgi:hypothetical protein
MSAARRFFFGKKEGEEASRRATNEAAAAPAILPARTNPSRPNKKSRNDLIMI